MNIAVASIEPMLPASTSLSLSLPEGLSFERWQDIGRELAAREKVLNWWIGDWWAFGDSRYGERAQMAAEGVFGVAFKTLINLGATCRAFPETARQQAVSFTHHQEIAGIARKTPDLAERILERAATEGLTVAQIRAEVRALQAANDTGDADETESHDKGRSLSEGENDALIANRAIVEMFDRWVAGDEPNDRDRSHYQRAQNYVHDIFGERSPVPDDFAIRFVELGRLACENEYRVRRTTVDRWLELSGKHQLLKRRAAFVEHQRGLIRTQRAGPAKPLAQIAGPIDPIERRVAGVAAVFLQKSSNGGWACYPHPTLGGVWVRGNARESASELIAYAASKGFDHQGVRLQISGEEGVAVRG